MEKQCVLPILSVCVRRFRCSACNAHAPCCYLWPAPLYNIFPHYLINGTIFRGKIHWTQNVCFDFLYNVCLKHFRFQEFSWVPSKTYMNLHVKCRLLLSDFNGTWIFWTDFLRNTHISYFMKVRPVGAELFNVDGWKDMTKPIAAFRNLRNAARRSTSTFCPHSCIYVFCVDLRTNSDYFPIQHWLTGFYNRDGVCLLRDTEWIFIYNSG